MFAGTSFSKRCSCDILSRLCYLQFHFSVECYCIYNPSLPSSRLSTAVRFCFNFHARLIPFQMNQVACLWIPRNVEWKCVNVDLQVLAHSQSIWRTNALTNCCPQGSCRICIGNSFLWPTGWISVFEVDFNVLHAGFDGDKYWKVPLPEQNDKFKS